MREIRKRDVMTNVGRVAKLDWVRRKDISEWIITDLAPTKNNKVNLKSQGSTLQIAGEQKMAE